MNVGDWVAVFRKGDGLVRIDQVAAVDRHFAYLPSTTRVWRRSGGSVNYRQRVYIRALKPGHIADCDHRGVPVPRAARASLEVSDVV